jgi:hemerythrin
MSTLQCSDALALNLPFRDATHHEFVDLLALVISADDGELLTRWTALIAYIDRHFARKDTWMVNTRFSSSNCHSRQYKVILPVMHEGLLAGEKGELAVVREMARELGIWFPPHAPSVDAALV